ncbi:MAG: GNAT family N-acetyltransferase [Candidatus Promineifilaceae bacterium]
MKEAYQIVRAEHHHLDVLAPLFDAYRVFYEQPSDLSAAYDFLHARLSNLESVVFLALSPDGTGLGFTQLYPSFGSVSLGRSWILYDLFVTPAARRKGVGRALMERAHQFSADSGAGRVKLSTEKTNYKAQALYESLGYVRDEDFYRYELLLIPKPSFE